MSDEGGHEEGSWWEKYAIPAGHAAVGAWEAGGEHLVKAFEGAGASAHAAESMAGMASPAVKAIPYVGAALGTGQALYHGNEMLKHTDQADGGYANNQFYTEMGEATLGGAGAVASFCPAASLYLGAGELAVNGLGWASGKLFGDEYGFSAGSVVGAAEHGVKDAAQWVGNGGVQRTAGAAYDAVSGAAGTAYDAASGAASTAVNAVSDTASTAYNAVSGAASGAYDAASGAASTAVNAVSSGASTAYNAVADTASSAYNTASDAVGGAVDAVASW